MNGHPRPTGNSRRQTVIQGSFRGGLPVVQARFGAAPPPSIQAQKRPGVEAFPGNLRPKSGGQSLPPEVQAKMESALGADFSDVRIHVGREAASVGAIAFTWGSDIHFAPGQYSPNTTQGQKLLGHELTHVVQQRAGRVSNPFGSGVAVVQDRALEAEADRLGVRAAMTPTPPPRPGHIQQKLAPGQGRSIQCMWPFTGHGYIWNRDPAGTWPFSGPGYIWNRQTPAPTPAPASGVSLSAKATAIWSKLGFSDRGSAATTIAVCRSRDGSLYCTSNDVTTNAAAAKQEAQSQGAQGIDNAGAGYHAEMWMVIQAIHQEGGEDPQSKVATVIASVGASRPCCLHCSAVLRLLGIAMAQASSTTYQGWVNPLTLTEDGFTPRKNYEDYQRKSLPDYRARGIDYWYDKRASKRSERFTTTPLGR